MVGHLGGSVEAFTLPSSAPSLFLSRAIVEIGRGKGVAYTYH